MRAEQIMTPNPASVRPSDTIRHAAELMRNLDVGALLVTEPAPDGTVRGIITDRDIVVRCTVRDHVPLCPVREHMTAAPLEAVTPADDVAVVMEKMERAQVRRIPVLTAEGRVVGIISQGNIATKIGPIAPEQVEQLVERISAPAPVLVW